MEKFRRHAGSGRWGEIHNDHFDWYMFPIEDGSQPIYNVLSADAKELLADAEWAARYHEAVVLYD